MGLRKGAQNMAANLVSKAGALIKTGAAVAGLARAGDAKADEDGEGKKAAAEAAKNEDPEKMSEDEEKRILRMIDLEGSSDEDGESDEDEENSAGQGQNQEAKQPGSDNDSFCSDNDILNRSL